MTNGALATLPGFNTTTLPTTDLDQVGDWRSQEGSIVVKKGKVDNSSEISWVLIKMDHNAPVLKNNQCEIEKEEVVDFLDPSLFNYDEDRIKSRLALRKYNEYK